MTRVGIVQFDILWENVEGNINAVRDLLRATGEVDCDLLVLPELWPCGFTMNLEAHKSFTAAFAFMHELAETYDCAVLGGLPHRTETGQENRCYLVTRYEAKYYAKMRVFKYAGEHKKYEQGSERCRWDVAGFQLSPFVCYDLRFPELVRPLMPHTDLISYVANWPEARTHHWRQLLIARAIENLAYVIGVNRIGRDGSGLNYIGSSMIISPTGEIVLDAGDAAGVFFAEIDPDTVRETREKFRFLDDMEVEA